MYKFYDMGEKPLAFDVRCKTKTVIPAGTKHVKIAFEQSRQTYVDSFGKVRRMNVYMTPDGQIYYA